MHIEKIENVNRLKESANYRAPFAKLLSIFQNNISLVFVSVWY